jgi:hypothetical protein
MSTLAGASREVKEIKAAHRRGQGPARVPKPARHTARSRELRPLATQSDEGSSKPYRMFPSQSAAILNLVDLTNQDR